MPDKEEILAAGLAVEEARKARVLAEEAAAKAQVLADALSSTLEQISGKLAGLQNTKASRKTVVALFVSIVLDIALSVVTILLALGLSHSNSALVQQSLQVRAVQYSQCVQDNTARTLDKQLWDTFFNDLVPAGTKVTPKIAAELASLRAEVSTTFALRNCTALYG